MYCVWYNYFMEKTVKIVDFNEDFRSTIEYWQGKTYQERIDALEILRREYITTFCKDAEQGFQRVYKIIDRKSKN